MDIIAYQDRDTTYAEFDEHTKTVFEHLSHHIKAHIPDARIEHVGSTAIGAGGKNIIDILVIGTPLKNMVERLLDLGFQKGPEGKRRETVLLLGRAEGRNIHIHVAEPQMQDVMSMISFRDRLVAHPHMIKEYEEVKKRAISLGKHDNASYNAEKAPFISSSKHRS